MQFFNSFDSWRLVGFHLMLLGKVSDFEKGLFEFGSGFFVEDVKDFEKDFSHIFGGEGLFSFFFFIKLPPKHYAKEVIYIRNLLNRTYNGLKALE